MFYSQLLLLEVWWMVEPKEVHRMVIFIFNFFDKLDINLEYNLFVHSCSGLMAILPFPFCSSLSIRDFTLALLTLLATTPAILSDQTVQHHAMVKTFTINVFRSEAACANCHDAFLDKIQ